MATQLKLFSTTKTPKDIKDWQNDESMVKYAKGGF
jgi:hypothetical protein